MTNQMNVEKVLDVLNEKRRQVKVLRLEMREIQKLCSHKHSDGSDAMVIQKAENEPGVYMNLDGSEAIDEPSVKLCDACGYWTEVT